MIEFVFIFVLLVPLALAGPAFVYVVALGAIVSPGRLKLRPIRRMLLFAHATAMFYAFALAWLAIATSGMLGEFNIAERRIQPLALFSVVLVPVCAAIIGRIWVATQFKSRNIQENT